ncbi:hypothetical protein N2152v2_006819 [Parachlorella kessleri]
MTSVQTGSAAEERGGDSSPALSCSSPAAQQSPQPEGQSKQQSSRIAEASPSPVPGPLRFPGSPEVATGGSQSSRGRSSRALRTELHLAAWQGRVEDVWHLAGYAKLDILFRQEAARQLETDESSLSLGTQVRQLRTLQNKLQERLLAAEHNTSRPGFHQTLPAKQKWSGCGLSGTAELPGCQQGQQQQQAAQLLHRGEEAGHCITTGQVKSPQQPLQEGALAAEPDSQAEQELDMAWLGQQLQLLSLERDAALAELLSLRSLLQQARHERNAAWAEAAAASQQLRQALAAQPPQQQQLESSLQGAAAGSVGQVFSLELEQMQQECRAAQERIAALKASSSALRQEVRQTQ